MNKLSQSLLALSIFTSVPFSIAQDYPYDEKTETKETEGELPKESPTAAAAKKKAKNVMRFGIKAGVNYTYAQGENVLTGQTATAKGIGGEVLLALGWDLAYQPVFIEIESGYRGLLWTEESKTHAAPLRVGFFYRDRLGPTSFWKAGLTSGVHLRIQENIGSNDFAIVPFFGFSSIWEFDNFMLEATANITRIESGNNFFDFAFRGGFRF